ncbi:hypothetical protein BC827DRAFT_1167541 [Russula dissimulans]|nr:hypothetical protein BC827DRAFT_1167541 [Russula dissimulans]
MSSSSEAPRLPPLPHGWVEQYDGKTKHVFYVDTLAKPPRATWKHPYEDEQYLQEHPDIREKVDSHAQAEQEPEDAAPPYDDSDSKPRRHSFHGSDSPTMARDNDKSLPESSKKGKGKEKEKDKRGFFGRLKDKAIGTKEEREAWRKERERVEAERRRQQMELLKAQRERYAQQQALYNQGLYRPTYGPPPGNPGPYGYGPEYGAGYGYGYGGYQDYGYGYRQRQGTSGGAILGAVAGGLLLGDILGGGLF